MQFGTHQNASLKTIVSNSGAILPSGTILDLGVEQLGFFKEFKNGNAAEAQSAPTYQSMPKFKIGKGTAPYAAQDYIGARQSKFPWLTQVINGKNIIGWEGTKANNESSTDIYTLGYDGLDASKTLTGVLDNRELVIRMRLWGGPIRKLTGVSKDLWREYYVDKGCLDLCKTACEDDITLGNEIIVDSVLKQYNADKFNLIPISKFVQATKIRKCDPADSAIGGLVESTKYLISFCDDGTNSSIGAIQTQYPGFKIKFESRAGAISTYSMWRLTSQGAPASFTNTVPVSLAVCDTCPSGYTLVAPQSVYYIERAVAPATDLTTDAAKQTYANTIGTAYAAASRGIATLTGVAGTGYTNGTHPLVFTGGGGTGAAGTITVAGGAITARTITNRGIGYTSAPTVTFPAAGAGSAGTVVATISAAPTVTSSFVSFDNGVAITSFSVVGTTPAIAPLSADVFASPVATSGAICTPPAGSSIAWASAGTRKVAPKTWTLTLADTVCGVSRLAELQQAYPDLIVSEEGTTGICSRAYIVTNYSEPVLDETCSVGDYVFEQPEAFLFNTHWKPYTAGSILATPVCTTEDVEAPCCAVGIRFETAAFSQDLSECTYGYYAWDISDVDPVYMDLTVHTLDWGASPCYYTDQVVTKLRGASFATGSGKFVREAEKNTLQDDGKHFSVNAAINEAYGVSFAAKPYEWYDTYKLTIAFPQNEHYITGESGVTRQITYNFAFPTGKGKSFETLVNNYVLSLDNPDLEAVVL